MSAWLVNVIFDFARQKYVRDHFLDFNVHADYQIKPETQNLIVYSGYSPFAGAGIELAEWSTRIDLAKPSESGQPTKPLDELQIITEATNAISSLNIPQLSIRDMLFINGEDLRAYDIKAQSSMLPNMYGKPETEIPQRQIERLIGTQDSTVRH